MASDLFRSPAIFVLSNTQVGECVQLMRDHNASSLLVVDSAERRNLLGIFTERDLLKTVKHSSDGRYWMTPVRELMSSPVKVIEASKLNEAGELMVRFGMRHLPIVITDSKGQMQIVGMLSMKDLLVNLLKNRSNTVFEKALFPKLSKIARRSVGVVTADPYLLRLLEEGFPESAGLQIRHLAIEDLLPEKGTRPLTYHIDAVLADLDNIETQRWERLLLELSRQKPPVSTIVTFSSGKHDPRSIESLEQFAKVRNVSIFVKPVSVAALFAKILRLLR